LFKAERHRPSNRSSRLAAFASSANEQSTEKPASRRLLKKVQMQGGAGCALRGVLNPYVAAPRERTNAADGPFSAAG
jgi:hypothetical protein